MNDPVIALREVRPEDLEILFRHQADPEACRVAGFVSRPWPAFLEHWTKILANPASIVRAVTLDGFVAGTVLSFEEGERRMIGYWIDRDCWGRGVATTAVEQYLRLVRVRPLHAFVSVENHASIRVLEKCGFERIARQPNPGVDQSEDFHYVLGGPRPSDGGTKST
jgi:RimJ/RimL family protein N-acetyltransferase